MIVRGILLQRTEYTVHCLVTLVLKQIKHLTYTQTRWPIAFRRMMGSRASETPATTGSDDVTSPYHVPAELMPVVTSLTSPERRYLPLWYLYDTRGSELCEEMIQTSKSYKLWKHEYSILQTHADDIASKVSSPAVLVDLGSAASSKTRLIIEAMLKRHAVTFVPVDTAKEFIETCGRQLERDYPGLTVEPFGGFYMDGVRHSAARSGIKLLLFLGSSLGNVSIREQLKMLQEIRAQLTDQDRFILGVDMNTDRETLSQAYGDQWIPIWRDNLISRLNMKSLASTLTFETTKESISTRGRTPAASGT
ncbi:Hypp3181 [Branchiostoma lanceolatum]|uniref:Hypp3181 protein n=1 Tax=Branchiostoma lanceolatum TaxID=7740 RepID=A0A8K0ET73_BRALA|nr:Hypp3181 [Branchiostoma lanceolatum]